MCKMYKSNIDNHSPRRLRGQKGRKMSRNALRGVAGSRPTRPDDGRAERKIAMTDWSYYQRFESINKKYLPVRGEGENRATQTVTAVTKLVYKWYNDGDVFDNTGSMTGWANDLSSYANWLRKYTGTADILDRIRDCRNDEQYEELLKALADRLLDEGYLEWSAKQEKVDSIYEAEGPYKFIERYDDDEEEEEW